MEEARRCPDEGDLDDFVSGRVDRAHRERLDAHIDGCASCRDTVQLLAGESAGGVEGSTLIGRYRVVGELGRGAMGVVYEAEDPSLGRRVAVKVLRPDASPEALHRLRLRLEREARSLASIAHPNVLTLYEVVETPEALHLVLERVRGVTLREWCRERPRSPREVRDVFVQAGEGIAAAHDAGVVHRDIKPENVLVGEDGRVRVTDFGLANSLGAERVEGEGAAASASETSLSATGALLGTPLYMAPERLDGAEASARSDQYSYCVALYEALGGELPFRASSITALREAQKRAPTVLKGVPARWMKALLRGLSERPEDRFATMRALLAELSHERPLAPWVIASVIAVVAVAGVSLGVARTTRPEAPCLHSADEAARVWGPERAEAVRTRVVEGDGVVRALDGWMRAWSAARVSTCRATRVEGVQSEAALDARERCLGDAIARFDATVRVWESARSVPREAALTAASELPDVGACAAVSSLLALPPPPTGGQRGERYRQLRGRWRDLEARAATGALSAAIGNAHSLLSEAWLVGYGPFVSEVLRRIATWERHAGHLDGAAQNARSAVLRSEASRDDLGAAWGWLELMAAQGEGAHWEALAETAPHADAAIARVGDLPAMRGSFAYLDGLSLAARGRLDEAERRLREALAARRDDPSADALHRARVLSAIGDIERRRGDLDAALRSHRTAYESTARALGANAPELAQSLHNLAGVHRLAGRLAEAREHYRRALTFEERSPGAESPAAGRTHNSLGLTALALGEGEMAEREFNRAREILGRVGHPDVSLAEQNLGVLLATRGDHLAAVRHFEEAIGLASESFGGDSERVARSEKSRGLSLLELGRYDEAETALRRAVTIARRYVTAEPATIAEEAEVGLARLAAMRARNSPPTRVRAAPRTVRVVEAPPVVAAVPTTEVPAAPTPVAPPVEAPPPPTPPPRARVPAMMGSGAYAPAQSWDPR